jgi:hypothetical protein
MTAQQYAPAVLQAGRDLGITPKGIVIGCAAVYVESDWVMYANEGDPESLDYPHDDLSEDANSDGLFQQRAPWWGTVAQRMDPYQSAVLFFTSLKAQKLNESEDGSTWDDYTTDATTPGGWAQMVQGSAFPDRYDERMGDAQTLYNQLTGESAMPVDPNRPDYNEFAKWCANSQDRDGSDVDLWLLHTQEGGGGDSAAEDLADFLISTTNGANPVAYHYTGSQASDGGVTIVDVVNTDLASWSVGNSNDRSINFCFAGSATAWTRTQWMTQAKVIDVAAYLFVQDCAKYPTLQAKVIAPNYTAPPGAADHNYCTVFLKDGNNHTDVGPNFPWDVFTAAVSKYADLAAPPQPTPPPAPVDPPTDGPAEVLAQVRGRWEMLGWQTVVEALAQIRDKVSGTTDAGKTGFRW